MTTATIPYEITRHAKRRWRERVEDGRDGPVIPQMVRFIQSAALSRRARRWIIANVRRRPGTEYLYSGDFPGIAMVVEDGRVVTVLTRDTRAATLRELARRGERKARGMAKK